MAKPGPFAREHYAKFFAVFGHWGSLALILQGDPIPPDLLVAGERLRAIYLRETEKKLAKMDEEESRKEKTRITWINDLGEECSIEGYLQERWDFG
jgi:hypothetical protein